MAAVARLAEDSPVLKYMPLVKGIAIRIHQNIPVCVDLDDLIQAGYLGLLDAFSKFDHTRGVGFAAYAKHRVHGSILDSLRDLDWASRETRRFQKKLEKATRDLSAQLERLPTEEEIADHLNMTLKFLREGTTVVSSKTISLSTRSEKDDDLPDPDEPCSPALHPDHILAALEVSRLIEEATRKLSDNYRLAVILYYWENLTMKEVAEIMGLNESRVSQTLRSATIQLAMAFASREIFSINQLID